MFNGRTGIPFFNNVSAYHSTGHCRGKETKVARGKYKRKKKIIISRRGAENSKKEYANHNYSHKNKSGGRAFY